MSESVLNVSAKDRRVGFDSGDGKECCCATSVSASREPVGDRLVLKQAPVVGSCGASSRACDAFLNLGDKLSNARRSSGWLLLMVDIEENLECVADCNEEVNEERLL